MFLEEPVIRPPSEAESILIQVTRGCSHNKCTFCGIYKNVTFSIKDESEVQNELEQLALHYKNQDRVFLCDGDALILPQHRLVNILSAIKKTLPWVQRVGVYANAKSLARKTVQELIELKTLGLRMIHFGLESGDDETLLSVQKWGKSSDLIEQGKKVREAGINLFVTVLLGLAGKRGSLQHAKRTGEALTAINPNYVGALSLILLVNTPLYTLAQSGSFEELSPIELLVELRVMLENTDLQPGYFYANHASNHLPLRVRLPRDKQIALDMIDKAIAGQVPLVPEWMRGL